MTKYFILLIVCYSTTTQSQSRLAQYTMQLNGTFGSHVRKIGLSAAIFKIFNHVQLHGGFEVDYYFKNLGKQNNYTEAKTAIGGALAWGRKDNKAYFFQYQQNVTAYNNHLGYTHHIYHNVVGTSQYTGVVTLGTKHLMLLAENDIFGAPMLDRFRTGAIKFIYKNDKFQFGSALICWTGEVGRRVSDVNFPSRNGYRDVSKVPLGITSHGICFADISWVDATQNVTQLSIGIDADEIRNFFQNKLMHDMMLLPARFSNKSNSHIPMISTDGTMFLYQPNQQVRPVKAYLQAAFNPSVFY